MTEVLLIIYGGLLLCVLARVMQFVLFGTRVSARARIRIPREEPTSVFILGGEIAASFYSKLFRLLERKTTLRMSLIAGPEIWVEPARYKEYFDQSTNKIRDPGNYFDVHPALAFWKKQPGRLSLFIKKIKPENERHFAGGIGSGLLYLEDPHDNDHAHGGRIFETQSGLFEEKRREFEKLTKDSSFCEELTPSNAYGLLEAVAFRPEPQRKRSLAQNQVLTASRS